MDIEMEIAKLQDKEIELLRRLQGRHSCVDDLQLKRVRMRLERLRDQHKNYDPKDFGIEVE